MDQRSAHVLRLSASSVLPDASKIVLAMTEVLPLVFAQLVLPLVDQGTSLWQL